MSNVKNIRNIQILPDGAYLCTIDLYDEWSNLWDECQYCARAGDNASANIFILNEINTGNYTITEFVEPPVVEQVPPNVA